jgi:hypothetical protein
LQPIGSSDLWHILSRVFTGVETATEIHLNIILFSKDPVTLMPTTTKDHCSPRPENARSQDTSSDHSFLL